VVPGVVSMSSIVLPNGGYGRTEATVVGETPAGSCGRPGALREGKRGQNGAGRGGQWNRKNKQRRGTPEPRPSDDDGDIRASSAGG
jgi:hypothetical protein